ncbi:septum formation family protein [Micromonospora sp. CPCC 206060]|uniref:septum formation family protein n=1 Tax=Micromonospora sp. CPCC 206060 TaxID=3122406 RepID=UPI002FF353EF
MRRWLTAVALGGTVALALTGCANPAGVDGELTDDWAMVSEAKSFVPDAGVCLPSGDNPGLFSSYNPLDCAENHQIEVVHVGTLTGANAERTSPPPEDSPAAREAFAECDRAASTAVGAEWRGGRLSLNVGFPPPAGWAGGARWFRCDLAEITSLDDRSMVMRKGSLTGALKDGSALAHTCFSPKISGDDVEEMRPVSCTSKHRAEFAGTYTAPDTSYDAFVRNSEAIHKSCRKVIASFAKVPNDSRLVYRTGSIFYPPQEEAWDKGDRGVQCFVWVSNRDLTGSVKGNGAKLLPVR